MNRYKTILLAVDLSREAHAVAAKAMNIAKHDESILHIVHVVEPISLAYNDNALVNLADVEVEIENQAKKHLTKFAEHYSIPAANQHFVIGSADDEIHALAKQLNADLIVIGSHGRSGISLLLGSTANSVLHGSKCDVLAVRVGKE